MRSVMSEETEWLCFIAIVDEHNTLWLLNMSSYLSFEYMLANVIDTCYRNKASGCDKTWVSS